MEASLLTSVILPALLLNQPELSVPATIYSLVMFLPASLMMWYFGRWKQPT